MAAFKLIIEDDAGKQIIVPFTKDVITIGRKEGNTIRLTERNVSRKHAKLSKENGHVVVEDLSSYNGIRLNGERIAGRMMVNEGDTIQIGDYHLALHAQDGAAAKPNGSHSDPNATAQMRSVSAGNQTQADDDEFAGDTQRWEPPANLSPLAVGSTATQEEPLRGPRGLISEETAPGPIATAAPTAEANPFDGGDTVRVASQSAPLPQPPSAAALPVRKQEPELEPTVRQASSPAPVSVPGSAHIGEVPRPSPPSSPSNGARAPDNPALVEETATVKASPAAGDEAALPRLVVLNTIFAGSAFPLRAAEQVVGRTDENDITIEHRSVSRNHAKVVREGDRVRILDLKSANGVLVNDEEVEQAVLKSGDIIELGRVRMRFVPVGERFVVPPEEIERARIADAAGDDFESDGTTGITNPVRPKKTSTPPVSSFDAVPHSALTGRKVPKPAVYAAIALGLLALVLVVFVVRGGDDEKPTVEPVKPPVVDVKPPPPPPPPDPVSPPPPDPVAPPPVGTEPAPVAIDAQPKVDEPPPKVDDPPPDPVVDDPAQPGDRKKPPGDRPRPQPVKPPPTNAEVTKAFIEGRYADAISLGQALTKAEPKNAGAWKIMGMSAQKLNKTQTMCKAFGEFLRLQSTGPDAETARTNRKIAGCK